MATKGTAVWRIACKELVIRDLLESINVVLAAADVESVDVAIEVDTGMSHQDAPQVVWPTGQHLSLSQFMNAKTSYGLQENIPGTRTGLSIGTHSRPAAALSTTRTVADLCRGTERLVL